MLGDDLGNLLIKINILMDLVHRVGGGFPIKSNVNVKNKTLAKSTIHINPSFHDICQNWYSKKVHNQGEGFGPMWTKSIKMLFIYL